jgi:hypothetical protein
MRLENEKDINSKKSIFNFLWLQSMETIESNSNDVGNLLNMFCEEHDGIKVLIKTRGGVKNTENIEVLTSLRDNPKKLGEYKYDRKIDKEETGNMYIIIHFENYKITLVIDGTIKKRTLQKEIQTYLSKLSNIIKYLNPENSETIEAIKDMEYIGDIEDIEDIENDKKNENGYFTKDSEFEMKTLRRNYGGTKRSKRKKNKDKKTYFKKVLNIVTRDIIKSFKYNIIV